MQQVPWLSVILPMHQGERWLAATLDSLVAQSDTGFECLVIDSSPDDATFRLAQSYADRLTLRTFRRPDLDNWRSKTNFGFQQARAEHVCMLHQDDSWLPGRSAAVRAWIADAPNLAAHLHPSFFVDRDGRRLGVWRCPLPDNGLPISQDLLITRLLVQNFVSVPSPTLRRDLFLAVGGIDESLWYTGDWDLYLKLARIGSFAYHPQILSCFRIHGDSLTMSGRQNLHEFEDQMLLVLRAHIDSAPVGLRETVLRKANASIRVNSSLAAAAGNMTNALFQVVGAIAGLRPWEVYEYLRDSRLAERVIPRLRADLAGGH